MRPDVNKTAKELLRSRSARPWSSRHAARHAAEALRIEENPADRAFDRFLPDDLRSVSMQYWTPLRVAKRAAAWLDDVNARHVVDIGSGAGKFCVAAALISRSEFTGLEQCASLVASARTLANVFGVNRRVRFIHAVFSTISTPAADAYYFYNPFGSYSFYRGAGIESDVECSTERRLHEIAFVEGFIWGAPAGTYLLTYNGFGGRMPECCDLVRADLTPPGGLRLWRRRRREPERSMTAPSDARAPIRLSGA